MRVRHFVAALASCFWAAVAHAQQHSDVRVDARHAVVQGELSRARELLRGAITPDSAAERAAAAELLYVIELWLPAGRPPAATRANDAPAPDDEAEWERSFAHARASLVAGQYAEAARRFDALVATAPDLVAGARAAELRALAREAAPTVAPAPPPTPAPAPVRSSSLDADRPTEPETETRWYGWQTLLADGAAVATTPLVPPLGVTLYFLGAPIIHGIHFRGLAMLGSIGVRLLAPTAGVLLGLAAAEGCSGFLCELEGAAVGGLVGAGAAILIDAAFIAREEVRVEKKASGSIVPLVTPSRVGVAGTF